MPGKILSENLDKVRHFELAKLKIQFSEEERFKERVKQDESCYISYGTEASNLKNSLGKRSS